jgi:Ni,Fe-hydrogenase III large subunit
MNKDELGLHTLSNCGVVPLATIPDLALDDFLRSIRDGVSLGLRVASLFGAKAEGCGEATELYLVLADDERNQLFVGRSKVDGRGFASQSPACPQVQLFEREIAEQFGILPEGHPWMKRVRYHPSWTGRDAWGLSPGETILPGVGDFFRVEGDQVHEVAVGPVHAGVIEPGHFRFQCHGEKVFHLEIALGYQHRGVEEALIGGPGKRSLHYAETLAGDSTIAHATTYCHVIEAFAGTKKNARPMVLRGIALELERLANHVGDLGALSGDVGFLPTASFCGRIRGDFLNMTALLCGNRFGRGMVRPGGIGFDVDASRVDEVRRRLDSAEKDTANAVNLLWNTQSVMARFEDTGRLSRDAAVEMGIVGPPARACGLARDVRFDQPSGIYRFTHIPVSTYDSGDVFGRAFVRWLEIQQSIAFIRDRLASVPADPILAMPDSLAPDSLAVALNEGWRGEVCHVAITDDRGAFRRYKVVDPSFHNWSALAYAMRDQEISDFPLCNKSFNLSYCGQDL